VKPEQDRTAIIQREMTITHEDFIRLLPKALADYKFEISAQSIHITMETGAVVIRLMSEDTRKIGALELPVIHITFSFENISQNETQKFFDKFDLAFQKGGG